VQPRIVTKAPPWHGWVTADLFLLSTASGTFTMAAMVVLLRPWEMDALARAAFLIVFPLMLADLACLILDLGDPARFHHMLRTFKPSSPMSVGVWTISAFSFIAFLAFIAEILDWPQSAIRSIAAAGLVPALVAGAYKGVLFSATAQPGWRRMRWLGGAFAVSSASMGAGLMLALAAGAGQPGAARLFRFIVMWLLVLNALAVRRVMGSTATTGHLSDVGDRRAALRVSLCYTGFIVAGLGVPIVLCAIGGGNSTIDGLTAAIVLGGGLASRQFLVALPHRSAPNRT